jgi:nucleoside-diphosphate-sugar epimerase
VRILVTGPSGNVGSALTRALLADSDVDEVVGVSRRRPDTSVEPWSQITWVQADLGDAASLPVLTEAARGCDVVVHLAWALTPTRDEALLERVNVGGTGRVIEAVLAAGVPHLVHTSSVGAYSPGPKDRRVDESWPTGGISGSWYSRQKAACERLLDDVERSGSTLGITRVRPAPVVQRRAGAELGRYALGPLLPRWAVGRLTPPVLPLPRQLRTQFVHAEDLAEALRLAVHARPAGGLNVAGEPVLGPDDLARAVGARRSVPVHPGVLRGAMDLSWHLRLQPLDPGWFDLGRWTPLMDTGRARTELGWTPLHRADAALADGVEAIRDTTGDPSSPLLRPGR